MPEIPWAWNGPLSTACRIVGYMPGHAATLTVSYQPCPAAQAIIAEAEAHETAAALVSVAADSLPGVRRYRRLRQEAARVHRELTDAYAAFQAAQRRHQAAGENDDGPGLARRLVRLAREVREAQGAYQDVLEQHQALAAPLQQARAQAESELVQASKLQSDVASTCLAARRRDVAGALLAALGAHLTRLIALDGALLRVGSNGADISDLIRRHLDAPVVEADDAEADADDEQGDDATSCPEADDDRGDQDRDDADARQADAGDGAEPQGEAELAADHASDAEADDGDPDAPGADGLGADDEDADAAALEALAEGPQAATPDAEPEQIAEVLTKRGRRGRRPSAAEAEGSLAVASVAVASAP